MGDGVQHLQEHLAFPFIHNALKDFDLTSTTLGDVGAALNQHESLTTMKP